MATTSGKFKIGELYKRLGIHDLPAQDQDNLNDSIANWRVHYHTEDGRLGSDLLNYHEAKAELDRMAQQFLDHNRNGPKHWRSDEQKDKREKDTDE